MRSRVFSSLSSPGGEGWGEEANQCATMTALRHSLTPRFSHQYLHTDDGPLIKTPLQRGALLLAGFSILLFLFAAAGAQENGPSAFAAGATNHDYWAVE